MDEGLKKLQDIDSFDDLDLDNLLTHSIQAAGFNMLPLYTTDEAYSNWNQDKSTANYSRN
jgi:hypothetical protein